MRDKERCDAQFAVKLLNLQSGLYPHMSVFDNMAYGLKIKKVPSEEIKQRVAKAAAIVELGKFLDR